MHHQESTEKHTTCEFTLVSAQTLAPALVPIMLSDRMNQIKIFGYKWLYNILLVLQESLTVFILQITSNVKYKGLLPLASLN